MSRGSSKTPPAQPVRNPFRSAPIVVPGPDPIDDVVVPAEVRGPVLPPGAPAPAGGGVLRIQGEVGPSTVSVVALHGGAGSSTLTRVLAKVANSNPGGLTMSETPAPGVIPRVGPVVLVARTSGIGLDRAHGAAREWGSGALPGLALLGLVFVADGPKPVAELAPGMKRVARMYPRTWFMPWVPAWHLVPTPSLDRPPRATTKVARSVLTWAAERGLEPNPKEINR